jgi:arylsulfatase A-like enzyme
MPTLLDALRIDVPELVQGKSLTPAIYGQGREPEREAVMANYSPGLLTFRDKTWKLVVDRQGDRQLFHLPSDPAEKKNVLDDHLGVAKNLERSLRDWSKSLPSYGVEQDWLPFIDKYTQEKIRETGYW